MSNLLEIDKRWEQPEPWPMLTEKEKEYLNRRVSLDKRTRQFLIVPVHGPALQYVIQFFAHTYNHKLPPTVHYVAPFTYHFDLADCGLSWREKLVNLINSKIVKDL